MPLPARVAVPDLAGCSGPASVTLAPPSNARARKAAALAVKREQASSLRQPVLRRRAVAVVLQTLMFKGTYVQQNVSLPTPLTAGLARPTRPFGSCRPSDAEMADMVAMLPGDHSQALFPSRPGRNGTQHLGGPLTYMEWVHMHCALCYISTYELELSTQRRYRGALRLSFMSSGSVGCCRLGCLRGTTWMAFYLIVLYGVMVRVNRF